MSSLLLLPAMTRIAALDDVRQVNAAARAAGP
jgi:hypothetical protein